MASVDYDSRGNKLVLRFQPFPHLLLKVRAIQGRRYVDPSKGGPHWTVPANLRNARELRSIFGDSLEIKPAAVRWGRDEVKRERILASVAHKDTAELVRVPEVAPLIFEMATARPFQLADIAHGANTNVINANVPGTGKTLETIGSIIESGLFPGGQHLVLCPRSAIEATWTEELEKLVPDAYILPATSAERAYMKQEARACVSDRDSFWYITTYDDVRRDPEFFKEIIWHSVTIDEFHQAGLNNRKTKFFQSLMKIQAIRKYALSGTPLRGRERNLWGVLHWIDPTNFGSYWNWVHTWLEVTKNHFGYMEIGGIKRGLEDEFWKAHSHLIIRRTKEEAVKDLPPKQRVPIWVGMKKKQLAQYRAFADEAELRIDDEELTAVGVLAEYVRLKQLASAECSIEIRGDGKPVRLKPIDSPKIDVLIEKLAEHGITPDRESDEQSIVATQFKEFAELIYQKLTEHGLQVELLTGATKDADRSRMKREFQAKAGVQVIVLTTGAGGVSLTLDNADSVHIMDETWVPDEQEQVEDRAHRISRLHHVTCYYYRTRDTIEEYVYNVNQEKELTNKNVLDLRRQGLIRG